MWVYQVLLNTDLYLKFTSSKNATIPSCPEYNDVPRDLFAFTVVLLYNNQHNCSHTPCLLPHYILAILSSIEYSHTILKLYQPLLPLDLSTHFSSSFRHWLKISSLQKWLLWVLIKESAPPKREADPAFPLLFSVLLSDLIPWSAKSSPKGTWWIFVKHLHSFQEGSKSMGIWKQAQISLMYIHSFK